MAIRRFTQQYDFLSNFSPYPVFGYDTVEHFYQAMKTLDPHERDMVRLAATAGEAKSAGRRVDLRPDWERIKLRVMRFAIFEKFSPDTEAATLLLETDNQKLVEGNTWHDNFWGDCTCKKCEPIEGENQLGLLLMAQRRLLRKI